VTESSAVEKWLLRMWYGNASGSAVLLPFTGLYGAITAVRRRAYRAGWLQTHRVGRPVIVVGNLTVGGTGKTPLVAWLSQRLVARGLKVAIVSRGYGSQARELQEVTASSDWRAVGDEPVLLARRTGCPIFVSPDRVAAAEVAIKRGADVILSDDGLQHLRLARDFEVVVIDGARGLGNQRLLPAGPLRESSERLKGVDLVIVNGDASPQLQTQIKQAHGRTPVCMHLVPGQVEPVPGRGSAHLRATVSTTTPAQGGLASRSDAGLRPVPGTVAKAAPSAVDSAHMRPIAAFRGQRVHAVAGIGNPERFFHMLRGYEIEVIEHAFPDHHPFTRDDLAFPDELPILMTEKDAVRCTEVANARMGYVPVTAEISAPDEQTFLELVSRVLNASLPPKR
jgi:tetraacyldisaccharide 4'-kinase